MMLARPICTTSPDGRRVALIFGAAEHQCGLRVCAHCGHWIELVRGAGAGTLVQGTCATCAENNLPAASGAELNSITAQKSAQSPASFKL